MTLSFSLLCLPSRTVDLEDAVSIHGDEEFEIEKDQEEKKINEEKPVPEGRKLLRILWIQTNFTCPVIPLKLLFTPDRYVSFDYM